jgi:hypothetical protein
MRSAGLQVRAVDLAAQHRDLVAQHEKLDVLGAAVTRKLGQHPEYLAQQRVHQRGAHGPDHRTCRGLRLAQNRFNRAQLGLRAPQGQPCSIGAGALDPNPQQPAESAHPGQQGGVPGRGGGELLAA